MAHDSTGDIPAGLCWQQRATRDRPGNTRGAGYNCTPLNLNYQKQSRINLDHYMFKNNLIYGKSFTSTDKMRKTRINLKKIPYDMR